MGRPSMFPQSYLMDSLFMEVSLTSKSRVISLRLRANVDLNKEAEDLKSRIKQQFTDRRQYGYRLHSVFIHRGNTLFYRLIKATSRTDITGSIYTILRKIRGSSITTNKSPKSTKKSCLPTIRQKVPDPISSRTSKKTKRIH